MDLTNVMAHPGYFSPAVTKNMGPGTLPPASKLFWFLHPPKAKPKPKQQQHPNKTNKHKHTKKTNQTKNIPKPTTTDKAGKKSYMRNKETPFYFP